MSNPVKLILTAVFLVGSIIVGYFFVSNVKADIIHSENIEKAEKAVKSRLENIREAEKAFKGKYQYFTANADSLTNFVANEEMYIVTTHDSTTKRAPGREYLGTIFLTDLTTKFTICFLGKECISPMLVMITCSMEVFLMTCSRFDAKFSTIRIALAPESLN